MEPRWIHNESTVDPLGDMELAVTERVTVPAASNLAARFPGVCETPENRMRFSPFAAGLKRVARAIEETKRDRSGRDHYLCNT